MTTQPKISRNKASTVFYDTIQSINLLLWHRLSELRRAGKDGREMKERMMKNFFSGGSTVGRSPRWFLPIFGSCALACGTKWHILLTCRAFLYIPINFFSIMLHPSGFGIILFMGDIDAPQHFTPLIE